MSESKSKRKVIRFYPKEKEAMQWLDAQNNQKFSVCLLIRMAHIASGYHNYHDLVDVLAKRGNLFTPKQDYSDKKPLESTSNRTPAKSREESNHDTKPSHHSTDHYSSNRKSTVAHQDNRQSQAPKSNDEKSNSTSTLNSYEMKGIIGSDSGNSKGWH